MSSIHIAIGMSGGSRKTLQEAAKKAASARFSGLALAGAWVFILIILCADS